MKEKGPSRPTPRKAEDKPVATLVTIDGGDGMPPEPDWPEIYSDELDVALAHDEWGTVAREMSAAQTLAVTNAHAIRRLVMFRVAFERAAREVAENGAVTRAKRTRVPVYNLHWTVMCQAESVVRKLEAELGLSPIRRARAAKALKKSSGGRAADRYLKAVKKG